MTSSAAGGSGGRGSFALLNRAVNPLVGALLRSPLHGVASGRLALITVTGRRTGRPHTFPVGYRREGDRVLIEVGAPGRKVWWRNLLAPGPVQLRLAGARYEGEGRAIRSGDGVRVEVTEIRP